MFRWFPLLAVPLFFYNFLVFGDALTGHATYDVLQGAFSIKMLTGQPWTITFGDLVLLLAVCMLFIETVKAAGTSKLELINHALSMLVFVVALVEFIALKGFGTSVFFFIMLMALFDTVGGYTITAVAAKRDLSVASGMVDGN
jgi:hypothetical protein